LFRDSIKRLFGFLTLIKSGLVQKKNYNPNKPTKPVNQGQPSADGVSVGNKK